MEEQNNSQDLPRDRAPGGRENTGVMTGVRLVQKYSQHPTPVKVTLHNCRATKRHIQV